MNLRLRRRIRPVVEFLEDRSTPTRLLGLTSTNSFVAFDSSTPGTVISTTPVTGLQSGEKLVGIDYRPLDGTLYGVGNTNRVYSIAASGAATAIGSTTFTPALSGTNFGVDFNPAADKLRVVSNTAQSLRLNQITGAVAATDASVTYDPTSYSDFFGSGGVPAPQIVAVAYTKNADPVTAATVTTLYDVDANLDVLAIQGGPDSDPSPNGGVLTIASELGFDVKPGAGFDIQAGTDAAFLTNPSGSGADIYSLSLTTGANTKLGTLASGIIDIAVAPSAAGAGTLQLNATTASFPTARGPLAVTVTRTGGANGAVTVDYLTTNGTAIAGIDFYAASGTLSFADGQTSQQIFLSVPAGTVPASPAKTFTLTLTNATGGATLGSGIASTITVPAVAAGTGKYFAVGPGKGGGPQVKVYDSTNGTAVFSFFGFESNFTGGVSVATGDVTGDGIDDLILGAGPGGGPRVRVVDGASQTVLADFFAYESNFRGGVNVAAGDVNGDGFADVIIGTGVGGGPRVRVLDGDSLAENIQTTVLDFFAYEDTFRGGVNVASAEFTGDGFADVVAGTGVGGGPRARVFDGKTGTVALDFFAYDSAVRSGVLVAAGDVDGDGINDVITGTGAGGGPNVRAFNGRTAASVANFFAYSASQTSGVRVGAADLNGDGKDEILTGSGRGTTPLVKAFDANGTESANFLAYDSAFSGGVYIG